MRLTTLLLVVFITAVLGIAGYNYLPKPNQALSVQDTNILDVRTAANNVRGFNLLSNTPPAPNIRMSDAQGNPATLEQFKGKVVLFNLWATWCPPCIREMPDLNQLATQYKGRGFVVVPVASGRQGEEEPSEFLRKRKLNALSTLYDPDSEFLRTFGLESLPTTFVIDREGKMRGGVVGILDWSSTEAKQLIEAFVNEQQI